MIKITYFVHGTTTDNEQHISSGWKDVELSDLGVKQSVDLKEQTKDMKFDVVFCSDQSLVKRSYDWSKFCIWSIETSGNSNNSAQYMVRNSPH